jgi:rod shape-determining protein MreC
MNMNKSLPERRPFLLLVVLLSSLLVLMSAQIRTGRETSLLEDSLLNVTAPLIRTSSSAAGAVAGVWDTYADLRGVRRENLTLREKVGKLQEEGREGEEYRRENLRLRELLELKKGQELPSRATVILSLGTAGQARTAIIGSGIRDGVRRNMPVVNRQGVVGRVIAVGDSVAKVQLLIDPNSGVAGIFQRTRGQGMVVGMGERGCRMEYVSDLEDVEVGDVVVTSGLDQIYPKGITIGVVSSVEEGDQLTKSILIRPEVDFHRLEEALVLLRAEADTTEREFSR